MSSTKPYYERDGIAIYHGDAREVLPVINCPQVVLTDPPYSSGGFQESGKSAGSIGTRSKETIHFDNLSTRGYRRLLREVFRYLVADEIVIFTDWKMYVETSEAVEDAGWRLRNMLVWDKESMGMGLPFRNQHELAVYGKRTPAKIHDGRVGNVLRCPRSGNAHHPTEKPVQLLRAILAALSPLTVIDPFMGSGTTLVAAKSLSRCAVGIELEERFCEIAALRLSQEVMDFSEPIPIEVPEVPK